MAWTKSLKTFGVCGNFRFEIISLTDTKSTRSLVNPRTMDRIYYVGSTNTSDNADVLNAQTLGWTGTADSNTVNKLVDGSETFDPEINGAQANNTTDNRTSFVTYDKEDTTSLFCHKKTTHSTDPTSGQDAVYDLAPDGNEAFTIYSERILQVTAVTAGDEGTLLIIGA